MKKLGFWVYYYVVGKTYITTDPPHGCWVEFEYAGGRELDYAYVYNQVVCMAVDSIHARFNPADRYVITSVESVLYIKPEHM